MIILAHIFATVGLLLGLAAVAGIGWAVWSFEAAGHDIDEERDL